MAPVVLPWDDEFVGRFIKLTIKLESQNAQGRKVKSCNWKNKLLLISLVLACHPCQTKDEHSQFLDCVHSLLRELPPSEIVMGMDVNTNIGFSTDWNNEYAPTLGPHGLKKQNLKGRTLLALYMSHDLWVMNTYYTAKRKVGYRT